jgi:hypothetical protein
MSETLNNPGPNDPEHEELPDLIPHEWTQRPFYVRFVLALLGIVLIVLGIAFWLMPVIPGFFLTPIGVVLVAASSRTVANWVNACDRRLPMRFRRILHHPLKRHRPAQVKPKREIAKTPAE